MLVQRAYRSLPPISGAGRRAHYELLVETDVDTDVSNNRHFHASTAPWYELQGRFGDERRLALSGGGVAAGVSGAGRARARAAGFVPADPARIRLERFRRGDSRPKDRRGAAARRARN